MLDMETLENRMRHLPLENVFVVRMYPPPPTKMHTKRREYRYELVGPPLQDDPVLRAIHATIRAMGECDMWISGAGIFVQNLSHGPPLWPPTSNNEDCNIKLYAWNRMECEFPSVLPVSIKDRHLHSPLRSERILVKVKGKWTSLPKWLEAETDTCWYSDNAILTQRKWWMRNSKYFPLMELPKELRISIYRHILGTIRPHTVVENGIKDARIFTFLGVTLFPQVDIDNSASSGHILRTVPTLTTLEIKFPNPYHKRIRQADVWYHLDRDLRAGRLGNGNADDFKDKRQHACYKTTVDWIVTFIFPHIKHIPNVLFIGAIESSVANKWSYMLNKEYLERNQDHRTHKFDTEEAIKEICNIPEQALPPVCTCPLSCTGLQHFRCGISDLDNWAFDKHDECHGRAI
ncbi:hypothetical protein CC86DRAFT_402422 [Ophiobolus disseminans]|uniref:Uncharacterized protein n=1 Tax=Ophiobolus disseminans TaxID=1469910 RepID=A0A6A7ACE1_9PLEO|nr:hypothetical protein CC86DRAFT_402422 [Ophiobolus disseminans]